MSKRLLQKYIPGILIFSAMMLAVGGMTQKAEAAPAVYYTSANGFSWADPFDPVLLNQNYANQVAALAPGFAFATYAQVVAAAASDGFAADATGIRLWLANQFFGGANPGSGGPCGASNGCDIRFADPFGAGYHFGVIALLSGNYITTGIIDTNTGDSTWGMGAFAYLAPEPSLSLLIGGGLMGLGYLAYRRKKA